MIYFQKFLDWMLMFNPKTIIENFNIDMLIKTQHNQMNYKKIIDYYSMEL